MTIQTVWMTIFVITLLCNKAKTQTHETFMEDREIECLNCGEIRPGGWIKKRMQQDLRNGFVGSLDKLVPALIIGDDIYGENRLTNKSKLKDMGLVSGDGNWEVQFLWWNSETQSNWWDGYIRHAILLQDKKALGKVVKYVDYKLATQDKDGYLGIYADDLRYNHSSENGELWAQASLLRGLIAYYEYTHDKKLLNAIEQSVQLTMKAYPVNTSEPFQANKPDAGICHGLTFTDICNKLYRLTNNPDYLKYAVFLYEDYNKRSMPEGDIQVHNLFNPEYKFEGHGVHTYEHLRALVVAAYSSGNLTYARALEEYLKKLDNVLCPSGGPIGDEWIQGRTAHSDSTGYEYCSLQELLDSYAMLLQKSGNPKWADRMEWLFFNAAQGARHPEENSVAYCKTDNSYHMLGTLNGKTEEGKNTARYKYSPAHQDVAVCCVPNAGRIYPYYTQNIWLRTPKGFQLNLFGPSELVTTFQGSKVRIMQETDYPYDLNVRLKIIVEKELEFEIRIRKPDWIKGYTLAKETGCRDSSNYLILSKKWNSCDEIYLSFMAEPTVHEDFQGKSYVSYGPLVFALELDGKKKIMKEYAGGASHDLLYVPLIDEKCDYKWMPGALFSVQKEPANRFFPSEESVWLNGPLYNQVTGKPVQVRLKPMGNTILRRVSFRKFEK